jgi:hypothetical protein
MIFEKGEKFLQASERLVQKHSLGAYALSRHWRTLGRQTGKSTNHQISFTWKLWEEDHWPPSFIDSTKTTHIKGRTWWSSRRVKSFCKQAHTCTETLTRGICTTKQALSTLDRDRDRDRGWNPTDCLHMKENLIDRGKHMCKRSEDKNQGGRQALLCMLLTPTWINSN